MKRFVSWAVLALCLLLAFFWWCVSTPPVTQVLATDGEDGGQNAAETVPPDDGGQPILVLIDTTDDNAFARYGVEILKTEGIDAFTVVNLSAHSAEKSALLSRPLIVSFTRSDRLVKLAGDLSDFAREGGNLLMIDPPAAFDSILGIRDLGRTLSHGYLRCDTATSAARGLIETPVQFLGAARLCAATTSHVIAQLAADTTMHESYPACGINSYGRGRTAYLMYDLGRSVVSLRQGVPFDASVTGSPDRDGDGVLRTADLYFDTYDDSRATIPQADIQQRLVCRLITGLLAEQMPLPQVWFFPSAAPAVALITGDGHHTPVPTIEREASYIERNGGKFTLITYPTDLDTSWVNGLERRGHAVDPHIFYQRHSNIFPMRLRLWVANGFSPSYFYRPRFSDLRDETRFALEEYRVRTGHTSTVTRTHFLVWWGWSETAQLFARHGLRMDLSVTGTNPRQEFELPSEYGLKSPAGFGYINGSGLPMKYVDIRGNIIDLFGQTTQVEDDILGAAVARNSPNDSITTSRFIAIAGGLIDQSVQRYHTVLVWNFHPLHTEIRYPPSAPPTWGSFTATVDHLAKLQVPMLSADAWLGFLQSRHDLVMNDVSYDAHTGDGHFSVWSPAGLKGLTFLMPLTSARGRIRAVTAASDLSGATQASLTTAPKSFNSVEYLAIMLDLPARTSTHITFAYR